MTTNRKEKPRIELVAVKLWHKLLDAIEDNLKHDHEYSDEDINRRVKKMKGLIDGLAPEDRKLLFWYYRGILYKSFRQKGKFTTLNMYLLRIWITNIIIDLTEKFTGRKIREFRASCEEYQLDITDYVCREREYLPFKRQKELVNHIIKCPDCRRDFENYLDTFTAISMQFEPPAGEAERTADLKRIKEMIKAKEKEESGDKKK